MSKTIEVHPAAKIMPEMSDAEYEAFKADIEKNGQREPVLIYENMVLDGRHRVRACDELGISVETVEAEKDWDVDPYSYVVSVNVHRRHLTVGQRSMIAAGLAAMKVGDNQHTKEGGQNCPPSIEDAAKLLNVSKGSVKAAKHLLETGSEELIDSVERGELSVSVADKVASTVPKNKQAALVKKGKKAVQEAVKPTNGKPKADKPADREVGDEPPEMTEADVDKWFKLEKSKWIKTLEAMMRGIDEINNIRPNPGQLTINGVTYKDRHEAFLRTYHQAHGLIKGWK